MRPRAPALVTWALLATATGPAFSQAPLFYRVAATQDTVIVSWEPGGVLGWTNQPAGGPFHIELAEDLPGPWRACEYGLMTSAVSSVSGVWPGLPLPATNEMSLIPGGIVEIGDALGAGSSNEVPSHAVYVRPFFMDRFEISNEKAREILQWAYDHSSLTVTPTAVRNVEGVSQVLVDLQDADCELTFTNPLFSVKSGRGPYPCVEISWYGAAALCNYRSGMEGLERCFDLTNWTCDVSRKGYRLPTEAEWEKAARGELEQHHFPWSSSPGEWTNFIGGSFANFWASGDTNESASLGYRTPVGSYNGGQAPAGADRANPYGLYDMAGNVSEHCTDWFDYDWYLNPAASMANAAGPATGLCRVVRGGCWADPPDQLRCAARHCVVPSATSEFLGLRCVRPF